MSITSIRDQHAVFAHDARPCQPAMPGTGILCALRRAAALLGLTVLFVAGTMMQPASARGPASVAEIAATLQDAVVNISTSQKLEGAPGIPMPQVPEGSPFEKFFEDFLDKDGAARRVSSLGSGFVIDPSGLIVTNNHVIEDADEIIISFNDGTKLQVVEVVGRDTKTDLALLRVEPKKPLAHVEFGDSSKMRVGDWVMAIGNPFGLGGTVTVGIVSATKRDINAGPYDDFIQTDAAINRGNSGGPLFNMDGKVIGINTAIISPTGGSIGIGFALPSNTAARVIEQLKKYGEPRRGWIGVRIQSVNEDIAESLGMSSAMGALVASVTPGGPSETAGLKVGDIITSFDGREITSMRQLPRLVAETDIGREIEVVVLRRGKKLNLKIKVGRLDEGEPVSDPEPPLDEPHDNSGMLLGLSLAVLSDELRDHYDIDKSVKGVVITSVEKGSDAQQRNVKPGDVIVEITHHPVATPADVSARIQELKSLKRKTALLLLSDAKGEMNFVALPLD